MPTPIDEMLITVEVEQGSKLEELYNMLKEFQSLGGKLDVDAEVPEMEEMKGMVVSAHDKINDLTNILIPLVTKYPTLLESIQNLINDNFEQLSKDIQLLLEWRSELDKDVSSILNEIQNILKTIGFVSSNLDKIKNEEQYKKVIEILNNITKEIKNFFQEQIFDEIKNRLDSINQVIEKDIKDKLESGFDALINKMPQALRAQMRYITRRILARIKELQIPSGSAYVSTWQVRDALKDALETTNLKKLFEDTQKLLQTIKNFVNTGGFRPGENTLQTLSETLENLRLQHELHGAKEDSIEKVEEVISSLRSWLSDNMIRDYNISSMDLEISQMKDIIEERIPKAGGWASMFGKALVNQLKEFKNKLDENLRGVIGEELDDWAERQDAMKQFLGGGKEDLEELRKDVEAYTVYLDALLDKVLDKLKSVEGASVNALNEIAREYAVIASKQDTTVEELRKIEEDLYEIISRETTGGFSEELEFIKRMLNDVAQYVVIDWIDELGTLTRQMLQILEDFGETLHEMGGDYNTLLHHYLKQELKIDRLTNLLGKKIVKEAEEFSGLREFIQNFDIPEKFEVLNDKINDLGTLLGLPGGWENILRDVDYIQDRIRNLMRVLRKSNILFQVIKEIPDFEKLGPIGESFDALMKILSTSENVEEALSKWRGDDPRARAGLRNISAITQITEVKRVLDLQNIGLAARSEDIGIAIENQVIKPYFRVWKKIDRNVESIDRKVEEVKSLEEQNMDKDSLNKTKLKE